ncbi:MAG TPA: hypothetical protein VEA61_05175 [Allosphingosinicella sp.]|nr:hypothetical protein [Allosphingosinicella sp.]
MTPAETLSLLKYLSYAVAAAAAIWAVVKEKIGRDPAGKIRLQLSRASQVAISLAIGTALIGTLSYGLESSIKETEKAEAAQLAAIEAQRSAAEKAAEARRVAAEKAADRREALLRHALSEERADARAERIEARTASLAARAELNASARAQIAELAAIGRNQRLLLASQPLRSVAFHIEFEGVPPNVLAIAQSGEQRVRDYEYGQGDELEDLPPDYQGLISNQLRREFVLYPVLRALVGAGEGDDVALLVDLDGTGSVLAPIGIAAAGPSRGFVDNRPFLALTKDLYRQPEDWHRAAPMPTDCGGYAVSVDPRRRSVAIDGTVASQCLDFVIHRPGNSIVTAAFVRRPRAILLKGGPSGLAVDPSNATRNRHSAGLCWDAVGRVAQRFRLKLRLVPNGVGEIASSAVTAPAGGSGLQSAGGSYEPAKDFGECLVMR